MNSCLLLGNRVFVGKSPGSIGIKNRSFRYNSPMAQRITPLTIGIAGGTGSGKTTIANVILGRVGTQHIAYLPHDAYYKDLLDLPIAQREMINFDHPDSLDSDLMIEHIKMLKNWQPIDLPVYDFKTHTRTSRSLTVQPQSVIIIEGILIFAEPKLRDQFDVKIFVDTDPDIRFIRRLQRDIAERGRTTDSVIEQYQNTVRPMHLEFVDPSKRYADVIIPEGGLNTVAMDMLVARLRNLLRGEED
jgi:uridine kinase